MSDIAIKAEQLSKYYRLGVINNGTLFRDIQTWIAIKRGKPDPHSKIGENKYDGTDDGFWALKDLNFEIKQGDRIGIIGKNGAGKSTLLKILSRITAPTEGCVKIRGRVASLLEVGTGFHGELTGRENIYLNGGILGMKKREVDGKIDEIIDFSGVEKHIDTPVKRYSSGMYVRLAFAVAAHLDSEILLADEVLAVGDAEFQKKALGKMNELSTGEGRTVLFVSHNMGAVRNLCNRGLLLKNGIIANYDEITKVIKEYDIFSNIDSSSLCGEKTYSINSLKKVQILKVILLNENFQNVQNFESQEKIIIRLTVLIRSSIPGLYGYLFISNNDNENIITCDSTEYGKNVFDDLPIGTHDIDIIIPAKTLGCGKYLVYINFTPGSLHEEKNVESPGLCCSFDVIDSYTKRGVNRGSLTGQSPEWIISTGECKC